MNFFLSNLDFIIFAVVCLFITILLCHFFWQSEGKRFCAGMLSTIVFLIICWIFTDRAARLKWAELKQSVEGYAATYAQEIELMGHADLTLQTPEDDPAYLRIIEFQKRCLKANQAVAAIYTMRMLADGRRVFMVSSETDYNRDGKYEGELEMRVPIGYEYLLPFAAVDQVIATGHPIFSEAIQTDQWGSFITDARPLHGKDGKMEGILGVDFSAKEWTQITQAVRIRTLGYFGLVFFLLLAGVNLIKHQFAVAALVKEKELRDAVLASEVRIENLVNSVKAVLWERDAKTFQFAYISKQLFAILGYEANQWLSMPHCWQNTLHPEDVGVKGQLQALIATRKPYTLDYRLIAASGVALWVNESGVILLDQQGEPCRVRSVLRDITTQKEAAKKLENLNKCLVESSRLAGMTEVSTNVIHNVGNVINSVDTSLALIAAYQERCHVPNLSHLMEMILKNRADLGHFLLNDRVGKSILENLARETRDIQDSHQGMAKELDLVAHNIMHIKEIIAIRQPYSMASTGDDYLSVCEVVKTSLRMTEPELTRLGVHIISDFQVELEPMLLDQHRLIQILVNLITNAGAAMSHLPWSERRLTVRVAQCDEESLSITLRDHGIGISEEHLPYIFDYGFTTKMDGHGFGLHSALTNAREMGGTLTVASAGKNRGAEFTLKLPTQTDLTRIRVVPPQLLNLILG